VAIIERKSETKKPILFACLARADNVLRRLHGNVVSRSIFICSLETACAGVRPQSLYSMARGASYRLLWVLLPWEHCSQHD